MPTTRCIKQTGFSLIELMITLSVLALLLALAWPSFSDTMARSRLSSRANELAASFALARSEALRRSRDVTVCPTVDEASCADAWAAGWMIWSDENQNGTFDAASDVVIQAGSFSAQDEIVAAADVGAATFNFRGRRIEPAANAAFSLAIHPKNYDCEEDGFEYERIITVSAAGIINASKPQPGACQ